MSGLVELLQRLTTHRFPPIARNGCRYVLRITRHGELILNK